MYTLILGRDMNNDQTDVGPEVVKLLQFGVDHQVQTGRTLVVAPGFSPDFPHQEKAYSEMMADWLIANGADGSKILVICAKDFDTYGELTELYRLSGDDKAVIGFDWHLKRAWWEAWHVGGRAFANGLTWLPVPDKMSTFDRYVEPLKRFKLLFPRRWQKVLIKLYKRFVSKRTSY